jgi:hypothetical protein
MPPPANYRPIWDHTEPIDRWLAYDVVLPATLLMHSGARPAGASEDVAQEQAQEPGP